MAKRTRARDALEFAGAILLEWVANLVSEQAILAFAGRLGRILFARKRYAERAAEHLRLAFPDWPDARIRRTVRASFASQAKVPVEALRLARSFRDPDVFARRVRLDVDSTAWKEVSSGQGAVIVSAHLGNWELAAAIFTHAGLSLTAVGRPQENRYIYDRIERLRTRMGQTIVPKKGALPTLVRRLKRGENVGLIVDQDARQEGIFVPFFGRFCSTYDSAAALALRMRRPIIPCFLLRRAGGMFEARLEAPVPMEDLSRDNPENRRALTIRMNERIEAAVRSCPEQWIWNYRRWKTRPPGEEAAEPARASR